MCLNKYISFHYFISLFHFKLFHFFMCRCSIINVWIDCIVQFACVQFKITYHNKVYIYFHWIYASIVCTLRYRHISDSYQIQSFVYFILSSIIIQLIIISILTIIWHMCRLCPIIFNDNSITHQIHLKRHLLHTTSWSHMLSGIIYAYS